MQTNESDFPFPEVTITSRSLDETKAILREYAEAREWWMIVVDATGWVMIERLIRRYYEAAPSGDYIAVVCPIENVTLSVVLLRRRRMTVYKYRFELQKQNVLMTERELLAGGALLRCAPENEATARKFAREVLGVATMGEQLALEE